MRAVFIDGDACPVKEEIISEAGKHALPVVLIISVSHAQQLDGVEIVQVDNVPEAVDIAIANRVRRGDIVVTQDYGLASLVLAKGAMAISPRGLIFDANNIDDLLLQRYLSAVERRSGGRVKGPPAFTAADKTKFAERFCHLIESSY